jgi:hypothetical protein
MRAASSTSFRRRTIQGVAVRGDDYEIVKFKAMIRES